MKPIRVNDKFLESTGKYELICGEGRLLAHIGPVFTPRHAANLLAVYPELIVTGDWSHKPHRIEQRMLSHAETASSHLVLSRFLLRLGVNARRFRLRLTEDAAHGRATAAAGT